MTIPEGSKVTMTVGPDTYEYVIEPGSWAVTPEVREHFGDELLDKINKRGAPRLPPGTPNTHIQKPSVGRIVHYHPKEGVGPYAAIVTAVVEDAVALQIFWPSWVVEEPRESLRTPFSPSPKPGHWSWPPRT